MRISEISLFNGVATYASGRTVMSETGLAPETEVKFIGSQSRWKGTGYRNSLYRIDGTDDLLIILHNSGPVDNIFWDNVAVTKGYFAEQKAYGQRVGVLARKYNIPFEVCLALGDNEDVYPQFIATVEKNPIVSEETINDLYAGISRRKSGLAEVLGQVLFELLKIDSMGQKNSERIAYYVAERSTKL